MRFLLSTILILISANFLFLKGQDISKGQVFYYDFNSNIQDASDNALHLFGEDYSFEDDRFGILNKSLVLNASVMVLMPSSKLIKRDYPMSFSIWVYLPISSKGKHNPLFDNNYVVDSYHGVNPSIYDDGRVAFSIGNGQQNTGPGNRKTWITTESIAYDEWHHIVFLSTLGNTEIYVDGCKWKSVINGSGTDKIAYNSNGGRLGIRDNNTFPDVLPLYLDGRIDDLYMWDRIITEEEILELYDDYHLKKGLVDANYTIGCNGEEVEINLDSDYSEVQWSDGQAGNSAVFSEKGEYQVSALYGCHRIEDTFEVIEWTDQRIVFMDTICQGTRLNLDAGDGSNYVWNTGEQAKSIEVEPDTFTVYNVRYTNEQGCEVKKEFQISIAQPLEKLPNITDTLCNFFNPTFEFTKSLDKLIENKEGQIIGDLIPYMMEDSINVLGAPEGTLTSFFIRKSKNICPDDSTKVQIHVKDCFDCQYHIPNIFSPNGDNINDQFKVFANNAYCLEGLQIKVYDRWGNKVVSDQVLDINTSKTAFSDLLKGSYTFIIVGTIGNINIKKYGSLTIVK